MNIKLNMFREYGNNIITGLNEKDQEEYIKELTKRFEISGPFKLKMILLDGKEIKEELLKILEEKENETLELINYEKLSNVEINKLFKEKSLVPNQDPIFIEKVTKYFDIKIFLKMIENFKSMKDTRKKLEKEIQNIKENKTRGKSNINLIKITDDLFEGKNVIHHVIIKNAHYIDDYDLQYQINRMITTSSMGLCINLLSKADLILHNDSDLNIKKRTY